MSSPPHLDAGRIYRLAPFEEVVTELRKAFTDAPPLVPPQPAPPQPAPPQRVAFSNGQAPYVLLGDDDLPIATFDSAALTARRTPAVSALATDASLQESLRPHQNL